MIQTITLTGTVRTLYYLYLCYIFFNFYQKNFVHRLKGELQFYIWWFGLESTNLTYRNPAKETSYERLYISNIQSEGGWLPGTRYLGVVGELQVLHCNRVRPVKCFVMAFVKILVSGGEVDGDKIKSKFSRGASIRSKAKPAKTHGKIQCKRWGWMSNSIIIYHMAKLTAGDSPCFLTPENLQVSKLLFFSSICLSLSPSPPPSPPMSECTSTDFSSGDDLVRKI